MNIDILSLTALAIGILLFAGLYYLSKKSIDFGWRTMLALPVGIVMGLVFRGHMEYLAAVGKIYMNLISASVIPLLFFSIISSISSLNDIGKLKSIGAKSIAWLMANTLTASIITLALAILFRTGAGSSFTLPDDFQAREVPSFVNTIISLFPKNIAAHAANGEVVPFIIFAIIIGVALVIVNSNEPESAAPFKRFVDSANKIIFTVIEYIIELTPYAVLSLTANAVSNYGAKELLPQISVLGIAFLACGIQIFIVNGLFLRVFGNLNPIKFFQGIWPALVVAFTSQTSIGTVPVTVKQLRDRLGVKEEIASFVSGLGANVGMPGCAGIWPVLLAVFSIQAFDIPYSVGQYVFLILIAVVVSLGTVGVPGTATITATAVFAAAGLPLEVIVILAPISSIADMARTATNVAGAAVASVLTAKSEHDIDISVYNSLKKGMNAEDSQVTQEVSL